MKLTPRRALVIFVAGGLALCAGLAWITSTTLRLERTEWEALHRSVFEEDVRLALWRMDAALATLVAFESSRPAQDFIASSSTPAAFRSADLSPLVKTRFEVGPDRELEMNPPGVLPSYLADLVSSAAPPSGLEPGPPEAPAEAVELEKIPAARDPWTVLRTAPGVQVDRIDVSGNEDGRQSVFGQRRLHEVEFDQRSRLAAQSRIRAPDEEPESVRVASTLTARWLFDELLLTRVVEHRGQPVVQGTWLDWQRLGAWLLEGSRELLPEARLVPGVDPRQSDPARQLALLPLRLEIEPREWPPPPRWSAVRVSLTVVWGASLLALAGLGAVLVGAVRLSQRRGDFVSAVTHELRTPLTTVRLYTDLLLDDMVPAGERRDHLETLRRESDRLGHLVDNVLAFARLERRSTDRGSGLEKLGDLLDDAIPRVRERVERGGLRLTVVVPQDHRETLLRADRESVGQILLNLADNACKYAGEEAPPELRLETRLERGFAVIRVRDFGAGVPARERAQLFRPFHRSARDAAGGAPGVGLGLALSRRLARRLGGDLRLAKVDPGAAFDILLRIPRRTLTPSPSPRGRGE